jgi:hypothetical protein
MPCETLGRRIAHRRRGDGRVAGELVQGAPQGHGIAARHILLDLGVCRVEKIAHAAVLSTEVAPVENGP